MNTVTNNAGATFTIGMTVTHHDGWAGKVIKIRDTRSCVKIHVQPDDMGALPDRERWMLDEVSAARHGHPDFCYARDHGYSMGNFLECRP
jgi:hypothetical protein